MWLTAQPKKRQRSQAWLLCGESVFGEAPSNPVCADFCWFFQDALEYLYLIIYSSFPNHLLLAFSTLRSFRYNCSTHLFPSSKCQWVYRAFEDVEELQKERDDGDKEESSFAPYPVENGSDHDEENGTDGTGEPPTLQIMTWFSLWWWRASWFSWMGIKVNATDILCNFSCYSSVFLCFLLLFVCFPLTGQGF